MGWGGELDTERKEERDQEKEVVGNRKKGTNFEKIAPTAVYKTQRGHCLSRRKRGLE